MAKITTVQAMRDYIKLMLGWPVINVELADIQIDQIIEDSVQDFSRLNYGEASFRDYIIVQTSAGVGEYNLSGSNLSDVYDLSISMPADGINTMFTPTHMLLYEQFQTYGTYPASMGYPRMIGDSGITLGGYDIAMMYLKEIRNHFGKSYSCVWLPNREVLKIVPTPMEAATGVLCVYRKELDVNLYNHPLMKKLCVARAKKLWGWHINKYSVTLPDGMGLNGSEMISEGKSDEEAILQEMIASSEPTDFFIG